MSEDKKIEIKKKKGFEVTPKILLELIDLASEPGTEGRVKKGVNVVTKAIEKGTAKLVVVADDTDPKALIAHIPLLAKEKDVPIFHVPSRKELGTAARIEVGCSSVAVIEPGLGKELFLKIKKTM